jgi:hypothetical protein
MTGLPLEETRMPPRWSFARKALAAAALVVLADRLFYGEEPGWTLGAFALAWVAALLAAVPALRRPAPAAVLALAAALGVVLVDDPNPLAWLLFWGAIASAALLPRHRFDDALLWGVRLLAYGFIGLVAPIRDALALKRRLRWGGGAMSIVATLALPVAGAVVFGGLFALANPLIGTALDRVELPSLGNAIFHLLFWSIMLVAVWPSLRPCTLRLDGFPLTAGTRVDLPVATLTLSLVTFNLLFAGQNALDIAFLWGGAALPDGVTLAEYAHRGAYLLIVTALLAGAFVLVAFASGSAGARSPVVRRLVVLWVAQNVLLVASCMLRTVDYIAAYSLTELRIAALAWMALVAVGLVLVAVRLTHGRSAAWLLNANAAAALTVLLVSSVVDYGAIAAGWNVDHARRGEQLDLCYLHDLGPSALLPLIDLERRAGGPELRDRARYIRVTVMARLEREQADWHSWTWRTHRRLRAARELAGPTVVRPAPDGRDCDGSRFGPPSRPAAPLTEAPQP